MTAVQYGFGKEEKMLAVLLNWVYMASTVFCLGCGFSALTKRIFKYRLERADSLFMAGIVCATVYAQFFSLFAGVGLIANLLLVIFCAVIVVVCRREIAKYIKDGNRSWGMAKKLVFLGVVLLWAYFTSRGYMHYDSDLYHAQSIRWIEEYGVVPGLGNLHIRFAYNSSFFALSALYSTKFLTGESMHAASGFFALILSLTAMDIAKSWKRKRFSLADYARVGAIYYLITITDEVVSPASDYSIMCIILFIVIKWLDLLEKEEKQIAPYALLCVMGVYALTLKLTAGLILLLLIKPAAMLIREKKGKEILLYLGLGLLVAVPWFARTVIISGWLIYPFSALDLFSFDWKMSAATLDMDAAHISAWGKALNNVALLDTPISGWMPNWFQTMLSGTEKALILGDVVCVFIYIGDFIRALIKKQWKQMDVLLVIGTVICSYLFWQFSAPLIRYGYAYVLLLDFLTFGRILIRLNWNKIQAVIYFVFLLYGVYKIFALGQYVYGSRLVKCYVWQADYGTYELDSYEVDGITIYYPVQGDRTGYDYFPATNAKINVELRGDGLKDGFRCAE